MSQNRASWFTPDDHRRADELDAIRAKSATRPSWFTENDHAWADQCDERKKMLTQQIQGMQNSTQGQVSIIAPKGVVFGKEGRRYTDMNRSEAYMQKGGWKLHLTVNPENYAAVDRWIFENHKGQYKLLNGGSHDEGTDFTIYVGDRREADQLARRLTEMLGDLLEDSTVHEDEKLLTKKVAGRFALPTRRAAELGLRYYGYDGVPFDDQAMTAVQQVELKYLKDRNNPQRMIEYRQVWRAEKMRIEGILKREFGDYYAG